MVSPYIRCPCCGKLARADALDRAGTHRLEVRRVLKGLGRGKGFLWSNEPLSLEIARALEASLLRALGQVRKVTGTLAVFSARWRKVTKATWVHTSRLLRGQPFGTWHFWTLILDCGHYVHRFNQSDKAPTKAQCSQCPQT